MAINQAYLFLIFTLNGIFIGILFDFFRILRKSFKTINLITNVEDIIFWILTGLSIIYCMYNFSDGSLRLFMFLGLGIGLTIYILTLSNFIIKTVVKVISIIKKFIITIISIITFPFKAIFKLIRKILFRPIYVIFIKIQNNMTKKLKNIYYNINKSKKIQKT
ncbi:MAG: spore cortex biosynthesis protein YabQ [Clostridia bacterium]